MAVPRPLRQAVRIQKTTFGRQQLLVDAVPVARLRLIECGIAYRRKLPGSIPERHERFVDRRKRFDGKVHRTPGPTPLDFCDEVLELARVGFVVER